MKRFLWLSNGILLCAALSWTAMADNNIGEDLINHINNLNLNYFYYDLIPLPPPTEDLGLLMEPPPDQQKINRLLTQLIEACRQEAKAESEANEFTCDNKAALVSLLYMQSLSRHKTSIQEIPCPDQIESQHCRLYAGTVGDFNMSLIDLTPGHPEFPRYVLLKVARKEIPEKK